MRYTWQRSLYNNWGLLYQEMGEYEKSVEILVKALEKIKAISEAKIKQATTMGNLANSYMLTGDYEKAHELLKQAIQIFVEDGERDFHYGATLAAMGDYYVKTEQWKQAKAYYRKALVEVLLHTGETEFYNRVLEKYEYTDHNLKIKADVTWTGNLQRSKQFYLDYGAKMIHDNFPEYEDRIAVGMVGEGSDCCHVWTC